MAGYKPGRKCEGGDVSIGMDCASSEFFENGVYDYTKFEGAKGAKRSSKEQVEYLKGLVAKYPIDSIEDGMSENDWEGWKMLTEEIGDKCQLVGDDLFVTNVDFLKKGIEMGCANSILIKVNQIGTLTETLDAVEMAHRAGYTSVTSHRSGETEDSTIADIAVATELRARSRPVRLRVRTVWPSTTSCSASRRSSATRLSTATRRYTASNLRTDQREPDVPTGHPVFVFVFAGLAGVFGVRPLPRAFRTAPSVLRRRPAPGEKFRPGAFLRVASGKLFVSKCHLCGYSETS